MVTSSSTLSSNSVSEEEHPNDNTTRIQSPPNVKSVDEAPAVQGRSASETKNIQSVKNVHERIRPKWGRINYVWEIDSFWELRALGSLGALGASEQEEEVVWSATFGNAHMGYWRLKCYPFGDHSSAGQQQVSLFLSLDNKYHSDQSAYAMFGCSVLGADGRELPGSSRTFTRQRFKPEANSWGWSQFIKNEGHSISRMLTESNKLIIRCYIEVYTGLQRTPVLKERPVRTFQEDIIAYGVEVSDVTVYYGPISDRKTYAGNSFLLKARATKLRSILSSGPDSIVTGTEIRINSDEVQPALYKDHIVRDYPPIFKAVQNTDGKLELHFDPLFSTIAVEAFLADIHVGINAIVNDDDHFNGNIGHVLEVFHLAYDSGCAPLYWRAAQLLVTRMVTEHDAILIGAYAKKLKCAPLHNHADESLRVCFKESNVSLLNCLLPESGERNS